MTFRRLTESAFGVKAIMAAVLLKDRLTCGIVSVVTAAGLGLPFACCTLINLDPSN
jgi:hypothetical protein